MAPAAVGPAGAEPLSLLAITTIQFDAAPPSHPGDSGPDDGDLVAGPPAPPRRSWLSLTGSVSDPGAIDLQALLERGERWRLVHLGAVASPRPLKARMTVFGEIPYLADASPGGVPGPGDDHEPASIGVKAEVGGFEIGAAYRSVGSRPEGFVRAAYRRGPEVWVGQRAGPVRVRVAQSRSWEHVGHDPTLPRTTEQQTVVTAELSLPFLPFLGLTYATGESELEALGTDPLADAPDRQTFDRITGSMAYGGERWHVAASSSFSQTRDVERSDGEAVTTSHALSLSLRPVDDVTVAPAVSFWQAREEWSPVRGDAGAVSLALAYAPPQSRWFASTRLHYTTSRTSDRTVDAQALGVNGVVGCRLGRRFRTPSALSLETGYGRYLDAVAPAHSSTAVWISVSLRLAAF